MEEKKISASFSFAALLTLAGGLQDSYSYMMRGEVFANAQTGNIVLLAQNIAKGRLDIAFHYLIPLLSFILGVYVTVPILYKFNNRKALSWMQVVLAIEIILLIFVGLLPVSYNVLANSLMSFTCAMQVNTFRSFKGLPSATTMCIGNMRSGTDFLAKYHVTKDKKYRAQSLHYFGIIFIFFIGAALGALLKNFLHYKTIWFSAFTLIIAFLLLFYENEDKI